MRMTQWILISALVSTTALTGCAASTSADQLEAQTGSSEVWPTVKPVLATATMTPFPKVVLASTATPVVEVKETPTPTAVAEGKGALAEIEVAGQVANGPTELQPAEEPVAGEAEEIETDLPVLPDVTEAAKVQVKPAGLLRQVDMYTGPGADYKPVETVVIEDVVSVLGTNATHDWLLVKPAADFTNPGWIGREHLEAGEALNAVPEIVTGWINSNSVRVRAKPSSDAGQVGSMMLNDMVVVAGVNESREWVLVTPVLAGGSYAWVPFHFVDLGYDWDALPVVSLPAAPTAPELEQPAEVRPQMAAKSLGILVLQVASGGDILVINQDGTGMRKLTQGVDPVLSPDGTQVAFTRWEYGGELGSLWTINVDGSNERQILGEMRKAKGPDWSPDETQIVLSYQAGGTTEDQQVCKSLAGNPQMPSNARDPKVKITNDGPYLCWTEPADAHWRLRTVNMSDGSFQDLDAGLYASRPAWDPYRVERIVSDSGYGLMESYPADGRTVGLTSDMQEGAAVISPDGRYIASMVYQGGTYEIHRLNGDGSGRVRLTKTPLWVTAVPGDHQAWRNVAPAWSPDGTQIAFLTDRSGKWEIGVMNADGSDPHAMFSEEINAQLPFQYDFNDERMLSWR